MTVHVRICHLYPDVMNLYGDQGNVMALYQRCRWRDMDVTVDPVTAGETLSPDAHDVIFMGGGQDREQGIICRDLTEKGEALREAVELGVALLAICGGYQLLGESYVSAELGEMEGIGIFDARTVAGGKRLIGNAAVRSEHLPPPGTLVGFENHGGRTYLAEGARPLGALLAGGGNNGSDGTEGCVYRNAFGTYLHGSLLPKNPHLADLILSRGLQRRYPGLQLTPLEDEIEWAAHRTALRLAGV
ncbi:MAG: glutamine amidotransferase, partial [Bacillota bacterium]